MRRERLAAAPDGSRTCRTEPFGDGLNWPPPDPTDPACIVKATRVTPGDRQVLDEPLGKVDMLDTERINDALAPLQGRHGDSCAADGANNAFLSANLRVDSTILWVDKDVTLFMTRNPDLMQKTGNCGVARHQRLQRVHRVHHGARHQPRHHR